MKDKNLEDMENLEAGELPEENIVGYNKISLVLNNFTMDLISPHSNMAELQSILNFYLLLHLDEGFQESWRKTYKGLAEKQLEEEEKKYEQKK